MPSYQYRKSHCGDKTVVRSSYLHNGISHTGKMTSLYWIRALILMHFFSCMDGLWTDSSPVIDAHYDLTSLWDDAMIFMTPSADTVQKFWSVLRILLLALCRKAGQCYKSPGWHCAEILVSVTNPPCWHCAEKLVSVTNPPAGIVQKFWSVLQISLLALCRKAGQCYKSPGWHCAKKLVSYPFGNKQDIHQWNIADLFCFGLIWVVKRYYLII